MKLSQHVLLPGLVALLLTTGSIRSAQAQVGNPGFEDGPSNPAPWLFSGIAHVSDGANSHTGLYEAQFSGDADETGDVSQSITTTIGNEYLVTFWAASDGYNTGFSNSLDASFGGGELNLSNIGVMGGTSRGPYVEYSFDAAASSVSTLLNFAGQDYYGNLWVDDVSVTDIGVAPVPEPSSLILFGIALAAVVAVVRLKSRRGSIALV